MPTDTPRGETPIPFPDQTPADLAQPTYPEKKIGHSTLPPLLRPMSDPKHPEKREEPSGATLSVEEWIELMNKHNSLEQYAKKRKRERREKRREEQE